MQQKSNIIFASLAADPQTSTPARWQWPLFLLKPTISSSFGLHRPVDLTPTVHQHYCIRNLREFRSQVTAREYEAKNPEL